MFYCRFLYKTLLFIFLFILHYSSSINASPLANHSKIGRYRVIAYYANELVRDQRRELSHRQVQGIIQKGFAGLNALNRRNGLHHQYDLIDVIPLTYHEVKPHALTRLQDQVHSGSMLEHMNKKHADALNDPSAEQAHIRVFFSPRFEGAIDGQAYMNTLQSRSYAALVTTFPTDLMDSSAYHSSSWLSVLAHEIGHTFNGAHESSLHTNHGFMNNFNDCKSVMMSYSGAGLDTHLFGSDRNFCLGTPLYSYASGDTVAQINSVTHALIQEGVIQSTPLYRTPVHPEAEQYLNLHMALVNLRRLIVRANRTYGEQYWHGYNDIPRNLRKFVQLAYLQNYGKETKFHKDVVSSPYDFGARRQLESQAIMQELRTDYPRVRGLYGMLLVAHWLMLGMEKYVQGHHNLEHFYHDMMLLKRWLQGEKISTRSDLAPLITALAQKDKQAKIRTRYDFTRLGELLEPQIRFYGKTLANSKRRLSGIILRVHKQNTTQMLRLRFELPPGAQKVRLIKLVKFSKPKTFHDQAALQHGLLKLRLRPRRGNITFVLRYLIDGRLYRQPVEIHVR